MTESQENKTIHVDDLQNAFNKRFCSCPSKTACLFNYIEIRSLTNLNITETFIRHNQLALEYVDFLIWETTSKYIFPNNNQSRLWKMNVTLALPRVNTLKGVILYFHPTIFDRSTVPSSLGEETLAIAGLYASFGYAVAFPDYIGFQKGEVHPYVLYPQQNVGAGLTTLNQIKQILKLYKPNEINLYTAGYSEGAGYSIWFNKCVKNNSQCVYLNGTSLDSSYYNLQISAGFDGAYDLVNVIKPYLIERVNDYITNKFMIRYQVLTNLVKPSLVSLTFLGYSTFAKFSIPFENMFLETFFLMRCDIKNKSKCYVNNKQMNLEQVLKLDKVGQIDLVEAIAHSAENKTFNNERYTSDIAEGWENSVLALVNQGILESADFIMSLNQASLIGYGSEDLYLFTLEKDSVVSPLNTQNLINASPKTLSNDKFNNDRHVSCDIFHEPFPVDHLAAELIGNIYMIKEMKKRGEMNTNMRK